MQRYQRVLTADYCACNTAFIKSAGSSEDGMTVLLVEQHVRMALKRADRS